MIRACFLASLGICLLACGCVVPALHALGNPADSVVEPALMGTWMNQDETETYTFFRPDPDYSNAYNVIHSIEEGETTMFTAHLFKLDGALFLDLYPKNAEGPYGGYVFWHFIPVHSFYKISEIEPELKISTLDPTWLQGYLEEHPEEIEYEMFDLDGEAGPVLTADTPELADFFGMHANTLDAFYDDMVYSRISD